MSTKTSTVRIIRVNGEEEEHELPRPLQIKAIYRLLGINCSDSFSISKGRVVVVDDTGIIDGKPRNEKATALYHEKCVNYTPYGIHGDVAICTDAHFN